MADHQEPQLPPLGLLQKELPDLGLGDQVQHGSDLVAQQIAGPGPQGPGDAEPLELPAGELPGIPAEPLGLDVEGLQQALLHRAGLMQRDLQRQEGVQGCLWVLPDHLHRAGSPVPGQGLPVQQDLTVRGPLVSRKEPAEGGLAPAAGGGQPQPLPGLQGKADVLQYRPFPPAGIAEGKMYPKKWTRRGSRDPMLWTQRSDCRPMKVDRVNYQSNQ